MYFEYLTGYYKIERFLSFIVYIRGNILLNTFITDACASNPCEHAESCVQDPELGYRCKQCHSKYYGPKCDERKILQIIFK